MPNENGLVSRELPVTFGVDEITRIAGELQDRFERVYRIGLGTLNHQGDIAFLRGVLFEVFQQGRHIGMIEEAERNRDGNGV